MTWHDGVSVTHRLGGLGGRGLEDRPDVCDMGSQWGKVLRRDWRRCEPVRPTRCSCWRDVANSDRDHHTVAHDVHDLGPRLWARAGRLTHRTNGRGGTAA
jgi:hypothetical protein